MQNDNFWMVLDMLVFNENRAIFRWLYADNLLQWKKGTFSEIETQQLLCDIAKKSNNRETA